MSGRVSCSALLLVDFSEKDVGESSGTMIGESIVALLLYIFPVVRLVKFNMTSLGVRFP